MRLMFIVVLFGGLAYMFLTILRGQDAMLKTLREDAARLEKRMLFLERALAARETSAPHADPAVFAADSSPNLRRSPERTENGASSGGEADGLRLDWPESSDEDGSRSESGGMPNIRI